MLIAQSLSWPSYIWAIAQVCMGLGFVIFVHELGHFLVAKACGVKCEKFYVGFDFFDIKIGDMVLVPRSLLKYQWGETEYGIGILPLGGYVKMLGQDDNPGNMEQEIERSKAENVDASIQVDNLGVLDRDKMDPRSFLAKSVLQRMAIISAGVVFNLIFAVLFAAIAFKSGVNFTPPIVGVVTPGGPAWEANLYGAHVSQVGDSKVEGYYRFVDLAQEVALSGGDQPIEIQYTLPDSTDLKTVSVTPRSGLHEQIDMELIGVGRATLPRIAAVDGMLIEGNPAADAEPPFEKNDLIVKIDDENVNHSFDLKRIFASKFDQPLEFVVEREVDGTTKQVKILVGPNPMRVCGLVMQWGPVTSIQNMSPASDAGIESGDQIVEINGQSVGDLYTLEQRMTKLAADKSEVSFTVLRDGNKIDLPIKPRVPDVFASQSPNQPVAVNSLGIAFESSRVVAKSTIQGISRGDEVTHFEFILDDDPRKQIFDKREIDKSFDLTESKASWVAIQDLIQILPAGLNFKVAAVNDGVAKEGVGVTKASTEYFSDKRGVMLTFMEEFYQSQTWSDAITLGATQTWWDASRVFKFLKKLVSGKISPKNLGGPGLIAAAATSEASQGTSRLLLFLTLLSANLAIVNFLPIPVLDGGHMLFLAYEGLFRQPPNEKVQIILTYAGLFMILGLMLYVILLDVQRFSGWF